MQLAITQPIRIDDALEVNGEWRNVAEITSSYVVIRLWDWRRMIVPLSYFIECRSELDVQRCLKV